MDGSLKGILKKGVMKDQKGPVSLKWRPFGIKIERFKTVKVLTTLAVSKPWVDTQA